jgi:ribosomal protein S28E/S33
VQVTQVRVKFLEDKERLIMVRAVLAWTRGLLGC